MSDPIPEAYAWLADALRPHCDQVMCHIGDAGHLIGIGCQWGQRATIRTAICVERDGYSLNRLIENGYRTQRDAVKALLINAPML